MLECTPKNLRLEREAARATVENQLREFESMVAAYAGPFSHLGINEDSWPENNLYEFVSNTIGQIIEHNPRVEVTSRRSAPKEAMSFIEQRFAEIDQAVMMGAIDPLMAEPIVQRLHDLHARLKLPAESAKAVQYGLNRWVRAINGREALDAVAHDMLFGHGVLMTTRVPTPDNEPVRFGGPHWPQWSRIPPMRFFFDPLCIMFGGARYAGHDLIVDRDSLLKRAKDRPEEQWNTKLIKSITPDGNVADVRIEREQSSLERKTPNRNELAYSMIWVPEKTLPESPGPEEGFHGTVYTLAVNQDGDWLREPFPYYGPPWGPYNLFGVFRVPNSPFPLAPLPATLKQEKDLNEVVRAMNQGAKRYKRIVLVGDPEACRLINGTPHDYAIHVPGMKPEEIHVIEVGGITEQQIKQSVMLRERLRRARGQTETELGNVQGTGQAQPSATRDAIAAEAASNRMATIKHRFVDASNMALRSAGWRLFHDDTAKFALGEEAAAELGGIQPQFAGGYGDGETFEDLVFEIDLYSMGRTNEREQRVSASEVSDFVLKAAPQIANAPYIEWPELFNKVGEARNQPDLGELIKMDVLRQLMNPAMGGVVGGPGGMGAAPGAGPGVPGAGASPAARSGGSSGGSSGGRGLPGNRSGAQAGAVAMGAY